MDPIFSAFASILNWDVRSLLLFMVIFILTADYIKNRQPPSFPPGPRALPIVGNMFTVDHKRIHESFVQVGQGFNVQQGKAMALIHPFIIVTNCGSCQIHSQLAEKYGDVFSLRMGREWMVVLSGFKVVKEALVNQGDRVIDRPEQPLQMDIAHGQGEKTTQGHLSHIVYFSDNICIISSTCLVAEITH